MQHGLPAEGFLKGLKHLTCLCTYNRNPVPSRAYRTLPAGAPAPLSQPRWSSCSSWSVPSSLMAIWMLNTAQHCCPRSSVGWLLLTTQVLAQAPPVWGDLLDPLPHDASAPMPLSHCSDFSPSCHFFTT